MRWERIFICKLYPEPKTTYMPATYFRPICPRGYPLKLVRYSHGKYIEY